MAKSHIKLPDGTEITIEGKAEEIQKIISLYKSNVGGNRGQHVQREDKVEQIKNGDDVILKIVEKIKDSEESEMIEKTILDRSSRIDKILLPLYIAKKHFTNKITLTTGDISKILRELGFAFSLSNIAHAVAGPAKSYVMGDRARKRGAATKYTITRKGTDYMTEVITSTAKS